MVKLKLYYVDDLEARNTLDQLYLGIVYLYLTSLIGFALYNRIDLWIKGILIMLLIGLWVLFPIIPKLQKEVSAD